MSARDYQRDVQDEFRDIEEREREREREREVKEREKRDGDCEGEGEKWRREKDLK